MIKQQISERFWSKVAIKGPDECWEWQASFMSSGYGNFRLPNGWIGAHRMAYLLTHGAIPEGMHLDHLCKNIKCCNPKHLESVTPNENAFRKRREMCKRGHPLDGENLYVPPGSDRRLCRACRRMHYSKNHREERNG